jgi:hypothetical protein
MLAAHVALVIAALFIAVPGSNSEGLTMQIGGYSVVARSDMVLVLAN